MRRAVGVQVDAEVGDRRKRVVVERAAQFPVRQEPQNLAPQDRNRGVWAGGSRTGGLRADGGSLSGRQRDRRGPVHHGGVPGARPVGDGRDAARRERVLVLSVGDGFLVLNRRPKRVCGAGSQGQDGRSRREAGAEGERSGESHRKQRAGGVGAAAPGVQRGGQRNRQAVEHDGPHAIARSPALGGRRRRSVRFAPETERMALWTRRLTGQFAVSAIEANLLGLGPFPNPNIAVKRTPSGAALAGRPETRRDGLEPAVLAAGPRQERRARFGPLS